MREQVIVVDDEALAAEWATAVASDGRRVVFVRRKSEPLIGSLCAMGRKECPIYAAFSRVA